MTMRVLIIGGYGNFGSYIARALCGDEAMLLSIAGRSLDKAQSFVAALDAANTAEAVALDIHGNIEGALKRAAPDVVIHTTGPFQNQAYQVARACIAAGAHYIDLADARAFVGGIGALDADARAADVLVVSGASSVPCLTAAIVDHYRDRFGRLTSLDYGISAAQQTNRGLATTSAVLSYVGERFTMIRAGEMVEVIGWQDMHSERYPGLGRRWFGNCDIPDLDLFPARYPGLDNMRFAAGHEIAALHFGTWALSWLRRLGLVPRLDRWGAGLLRIAKSFDVIGSDRSGFHMMMSGKDDLGTDLSLAFHLIARSGHGPYIPCMPAILIARGLASGEIAKRGATPCLDLIDLPTYLGALKGLDVEVFAPDA